jgi:hypothetical protein
MEMDLQLDLGYVLKLRDQALELDLGYVRS